MKKFKLLTGCLTIILLLSSCASEGKPVPLETGSALTASETADAETSVAETAAMPEANPASQTLVEKEEVNPGGRGDEVFDISLYDGKLTIHFFSLEKIGSRMGDSIFIRTPNGVTMLIDSGEMSRGSIVVDYLKKMGVEKLDYAVGTHFHTDHVNGYQTVLAEISVGKFLMPQFVNYNTPVSKALFDMLEIKNIPVEYAISGNTFQLDEQVSIEVLNPEGNMVVPEGMDLSLRDDYVNDRSIVLKMNYHEKSFIFAGDIYKDREYELYKTMGEKLDADLLKAPHHGLKSSSSLDFVDSVSADIVVMTSGIPDKEIYDRYRRRESKVYVTGADGTVLVVCDGKRMEVLCERDRELKNYYN